MNPEMHVKVEVWVACSGIDKAPSWSGIGVGLGHTYRILKCVVDSFRLGAVLLIEGSTLHISFSLDMGAALLITLA
jgi:hypothetical protein